MLGQDGLRPFGKRALRQALLFGEHALDPGKRREPRVVRHDPGKVERAIEGTQMAANAFGQSIDNLPAHGQLARWLYADALPGDLQCLLGMIWNARWRTSPKGVMSDTVSST